jgi:hypothetical protein
MIGNGLGMFERAAILQISSNPGSAKSVQQVE